MRLIPQFARLSGQGWIPWQQTTALLSMSLDSHAGLCAPLDQDHCWYCQTEYDRVGGISEALYYSPALCSQPFPMTSGIKLYRAFLWSLQKSLFPDLPGLSISRILILRVSSLTSWECLLKLR